MLLFLAAKALSQSSMRQALHVSQKRTLTAMSTSALSPSWTAAMTRPVAGSFVSKTLPLFAFTNSLLIKSCESYFRPQCNLVVVDLRLADRGRDGEAAAGDGHCRDTGEELRYGD